MNQIRKLLKIKLVDRDELRTLNGHLNHASAIMPLARHFMNRLHQLETVMEPYKKYSIRIPLLEDLKLHHDILTKASQGISMNLLTYWEPTRGYQTDACEYGIGGHNTVRRGYRWKIPHHLLGIAHINVLEFLGELVGPWIDIIEGTLGQEECILSMGDSSTAIGWIHRSRVKKKEQCQFDYEAKQYHAGFHHSLALLGMVPWAGQHHSGLSIPILVLQQRRNHPTSNIHSPKIDSSKVLNSTDPERDRLISLLNLVAIAQEDATVDSTKDKRIHAWRIWREFLPTIGIRRDEYLETFPPGNDTSYCSLSGKQYEMQNTRRDRVRDDWLRQQSAIPLHT